MAPAREGAPRGREWEGARCGGAQAQEVAAHSRSAAAPLAFSFRWRKTLSLRVWQMYSRPPPVPVFTKAKTDFDCWAAKGPADSQASISGLMVDRSPAGSPQLVHLVCVRHSRGSPGGGERVPSPPPATGPFWG